MNRDARVAKCRRDRCRYIFILGRQDAWPRWKSCIREPNALKIEATCTPVAPAPMTSIDGGTEVRLQASLWVFVNSKPGTEAAG